MRWMRVPACTFHICNSTTMASIPCAKTSTQNPSNPRLPQAAKEILSLSRPAGTLSGCQMHLGPTSLFQTSE